MDQFIKEIETALHGIIQKLEEEIRGVRSNRPSVQLVEDIKAEYYGQELPIKQLGSLNIRPPRDIEVHVWDKNAAAAVSKAIENAKMGFSVANEGTVVRVSLPPLTDERRAELMKLVKKMAETARIQIRGKRDDIIKKVKAAEDEKKLSEDQVFRGKEKIQKVVDDANKNVESLLDGKSKELQE